MSERIFFNEDQFLYHCKERGTALLETMMETIGFIVRGVMALMAILIVLRCYSSMRKNIREDKPLIMLFNALTNQEIPVMFWENSIGRSKNSDIVLKDPTVSRDHAVLLRREEGWMIADTKSKAGIYVNGKLIDDRHQVYIDDMITVGATPLVVKKCRQDISSRSGWKYGKKQKKTKAASAPLLFLITIFHLLSALQLCFIGGTFQYDPLVPFGILIAAGWIFFWITKGIFKRVNFELEMLAFFLSGIGIALICGDDVKETYTQVATVIMGMVLFCLILWFIEDPDRVMKWRLWISIGAIGLFVLNLLIGTVQHGAQNWIIIGPISIQPSEFIKIAFVFVGASTLDRLQTAKNLTEFIVFSALCIGALFLMGDFGTAVIFFVTFLIIAFMRSGDIRTIILICAAAALGAFIILKFKPYVADRFAAWGHVWDYADTLGYQQTRVLTYAASGGLFGVGLGLGELKYVFAATSDLIFGMMCEEMGLIIAIISVLAIGGLVLYSRKASSKSRSTFYYIAACSAAGMLVFQACLNIFGATDVLPLTGVTLPFISMGGSSMIAVWGLLAFIKAADERTYAVRRG